MKIIRDIKLKNRCSKYKCHLSNNYSFNIWISKIIESINSSLYISLSSLIIIQFSFNLLFFTAHLIKSVLQLSEALSHHAAGKLGAWWHILRFSCILLIRTSSSAAVIITASAPFGRAFAPQWAWPLLVAGSMWVSWGPSLFSPWFKQRLNALVLWHSLAHRPWEILLVETEDGLNSFLALSHSLLVVIYLVSRRRFRALFCVSMRWLWSWFGSQGRVAWRLLIVVLVVIWMCLLQNLWWRAHGNAWISMQNRRDWPIGSQWRMPNISWHYCLIIAKRVIIGIDVFSWYMCFHLSPIFQKFKFSNLIRHRIYFKPEFTILLFQELIISINLVIFSLNCSSITHFHVQLAVQVRFLLDQFSHLRS